MSRLNGDDKKKRLTPRFTRARRAYALRLAQSGEINLNKNLAWGVGANACWAAFYFYDTVM